MGFLFRTSAPARRLSCGAVLAVVASAVLAFTSGCGASTSSETSGTSTSAVTPSLTSTTASTATTSASTPSKPPATHKPKSRTPRRPPVAATPTVGHPTKSSGCQVRGELPDPACTPGGIFVAATVSQICTPGYSEGVRDVSDSTKEEVYAAYGITSHAPESYEVDHLIPLELGGNNTVANLWPEASPGSHKKDTVENELHHAVCDGRIGLRTAQQEIAHDWRQAAVGPPSTSSATTGRSETHTTPTSSSSTSESAQVVHPGAFCSPEGAHGVTSHGTPMTCKTTSSDTRARWRSSS